MRPLAAALLVTCLLGVGAVPTALAQDGSAPPIRHAALVAQFPSTLGGQALGVEDFSGPEWISRYDPQSPEGAVALQRAEALLAAAGKSVEDLTVATALHVPSPGNVATIAAFQLRGIEAHELVEPVIGLMRGEIGSPQLRLRHIVDRTVLEVRDASVPGLYPVTVYPVGDTVWFVDAGGPLLEQILEALPQAAGAPPSLPPFDRTMTLAPVEPNVVRVLDDGAGHDLTDVNTFEDLKPASLFAAGDDGSVWMTSSGGFIKIGTPGEVHNPLATFLPQMEIGPDGALWIADVYQGTTHPQGAQGSIGRWYEGAWSIHQLPSEARVVWLDAREDGGLDFAWRDETTLTFGVVEPGAGVWMPSPLPPLPLVSADGFMAVERTPDGQLWVAEGPWWYEEQRHEPGPLWTFEGSAWQAVQPLGDLPVRPMMLVAEPVGTLLVGWQEVAADVWEPDAAWHTTRLEEDGEWSVLDIVESVTTEHGGCRGYAHIDGERLTRYLDGVCLRPVAITPSGEVWAFGTDRNRKNHAVYVITPDR